MFLTNIRSLSDTLLTLVFPQPCVICRQSVERRELGITCEECWTSTRLISESDPICWKCGTLAYGSSDPAGKFHIRCGRCDGFDFGLARACGLYEKALRESVLRLKQQPNLPETVARMLSAAASRAPLTDTTIIIPVPLHVERKKARGFNQAMVIASAIGKSTGLPINDVSLIRTTHALKYRAGMDVKGRSDTVVGAFEVVYPRLVVNEKILLVDDVFTTGATVAECSKALVQAGAAAVNVLTIARTTK